MSVLKLLSMIQWSCFLCMCSEMQALGYAFHWADISIILSLHSPSFSLPGVTLKTSFILPRRVELKFDFPWEIVLLFVGDIFSLTEI